MTHFPHCHKHATPQHNCPDCAPVPDTPEPNHADCKPTLTPVNPLPAFQPQHPSPHDTLDKLRQTVELLCELLKDLTNELHKLQNQKGTNQNGHP